MLSWGLPRPSDSKPCRFLNSELITPNSELISFPSFSLSKSKDILKVWTKHQSGNRLPKWELWLGTDPLNKANLEDNLKGHLALIKRWGQDILCLPLSNDRSMNKALGCRYFSLNELKEASRRSDRF